jgi:uncharacterized membrane-anchored protein YhcB (DUF1043 family)
MIEIIIAFIVGVVLGYITHNVFKPRVTEDVEKAIALLKSKGYWVTVNVNPNKEQKRFQ